jgi:hypothetical protein
VQDQPENTSEIVIAILDIMLKDNATASINIRSSDNPNQLAIDFCAKH